MVHGLDIDLKRKRSAKDQKDFIREFLRIAADNWSEAHPVIGGSNLSLGVWDRAVEAESLLHNARKECDVQDIPEKLVTLSMMKKKAAKKKKKSSSSSDPIVGLAAFQL
jgi:hypothetical protein